VVLMESEERGPVRLTTAGAHATESRELAFDEASAILNELQRLGAIPAGDSENDDAIAQ
jgi:hypothetical protein